MSVRDSPASLQAELVRGGLHCTLEWVTACLDWLAGEHGNLTRQAALLKLQEQWSLTDLRTPGLMEAPSLPAGLDQAAKQTLPGRYHLQVLSAHDAGSPAYGQLQKLHQVEQENVRVSAEDASQATQGGGGYSVTQGAGQQAAWQPRPQRHLLLTLTDGFQTVRAMEHQPLPALPDPPTLAAGAKLLVTGPVVARRGVLLLTTAAVKLLGGSVEELQQEFSLLATLQAKIGTDNVGQKPRFVPVPPPGHASVPVPGPRPQPAPAPAPVPVPTPRLQRTPAALPPRPNRPVQRVPPVINHASAPIPTAGSDMDDDDDEFLLACSGEPASVPVSGPAGRHLRTLQLSNLPSSTGLRTQTAITSFLQPTSKPDTVQLQPSQPIPHQPSQQQPDFSLLDSDDEFLSELPEPAVTPSPVQLASEPWQYLSSLLGAGAGTVARIKAVSSTLASKLKLARTATGPQWQVSVWLNDGSAAVRAAISPALLEMEIGPADRYPQLGPVEKAEFKEKMRHFSRRLADLNCLVSLQWEGEDNAMIVKLEPITALHVAQMRRRKLK